MSIFAPIGRMLVVSLFILSGIQKLRQFDINTGGDMMNWVAPKLDTAFATVKGHLPADIKLDVKSIQVYYPYLLLASVVLELSGAVLFLLNSTLGAYLLALFTLIVTPVMHDFWNVSDEESKQTELISAFKNMVILGGLMVFIAQKSQLGRRNSN